MARFGRLLTPALLLVLLVGPALLRASVPNEDADVYYDDEDEVSPAGERWAWAQQVPWNASTLPPSPPPPIPPALAVALASLPPDLPPILLVPNGPPPSVIPLVPAGAAPLLTAEPGTVAQVTGATWQSLMVSPIHVLGRSRSLLVSTRSCAIRPNSKVKLNHPLTCV
jgi:hypothetical protein